MRIPKFVRSKKFVAFLAITLGVLMFFSLAQPFIAFNAEDTTPDGKAKVAFQGKVELNLYSGNETVGEAKTIHLAWISSGDTVVDSFGFTLYYMVKQVNNYTGLYPTKILVGISLKLLDGGHGQQDINENAKFYKYWSHSMPKEDLGKQQTFYTDPRINIADLYIASYGDTKPTEGEEYWWKFQITVFANITFNTGDKALPYARGTFELRITYKSDFTDAYSVDISAGTVEQSAGAGGDILGTGDITVGAVYPLAIAQAKTTKNDYLLPTVLILVGMFLFWRERKK